MIASLLDNDLYKFTMQQAVLELHPTATAVYEFINRTPADRFNEAFFAAFQDAVADMPGLRLREDEKRFLGCACPYFRPAYLTYLEQYRFDPGEVHAELSQDGALRLTIEGPWHRVILWEVPLLALVSELYFQHVDTNWSNRSQLDRLRRKGELLQREECPFADFGTRRRRNYTAQDRVVQTFCTNPVFIGTSNVHLAHRHSVAPVGTMAHEFVMAQSVLAGLRRANRFALEAWHRVYRGQLGIALADTYGSQAFFADFNAHYAAIYDGIRQDSGCPFTFADRAVEHYRHLGIDPATKTIVFSDSLTPELAVRLKQHCDDRIRCAFGIGTNLTNDFPKSEALNIVIKLAAVNGAGVAKLTDDPAKASGEPAALELARRTFLESPCR